MKFFFWVYKAHTLVLIVLVFKVKWQSEYKHEENAKPERSKEREKFVIHFLFA